MLVEALRAQTAVERLDEGEWETAFPWKTYGRRFAAPSPRSPLRIRSSASPMIAASATLATSATLAALTIIVARGFRKIYSLRSPSTPNGASAALGAAHLSHSLVLRV